MVGRQRPRADARLLADSSESQSSPAEQPTPRPRATAEIACARAGRDVALALAIGLAAGLLGLAPWLITGARLLQNLWGAQVMPAGMPLGTASPEPVRHLVACMVTGGASAGSAGPVLVPRAGLLATWCAAGGAPGAGRLGGSGVHCARRRPGARAEVKPLLGRHAGPGGCRQWLRGWCRCCFSPARSTALYPGRGPGGRAPRAPG